MNSIVVKLEIADSVDCVNAMNEPRTLIGFAPFTAETDAQKKLPINKGERELNDEYVKAICDAMTKTNDPTAAIKDSSHKREGTFAYAPQSGEKGDCSAAVNYWKASGSSFGNTLPPVYQSDAQAPYNSPEARSFVSLFNPGSNPTVDCAYITCTTTTTTPEPTTKPGQGEKQKSGKAQQSYSSLRTSKTNASNIGHAAVPAAGDAIAKTQLVEGAVSEPAYENTKNKDAGIATGSPDTSVQQKSSEAGSAASAAPTVKEGKLFDGVSSGSSFYAAYSSDLPNVEDGEAGKKVPGSSSAMAYPISPKGEDKTQSVLRGAGPESQAAPLISQGAGDTPAKSMDTTATAESDASEKEVEFTAKNENKDVGPQTRRLQDKDEDAVTTVSGIVCVTYPKAPVENAAPFSQEQWDKINGASGNGSPSISMTPLLAIAVSAFGVFLF